MSFISNILGKSSGEKRVAAFTPSGFSSRGLSGSFTNNTFTLRRGDDVSEALGGIQGLSQEQASAFRGLRDRVRPGFGELTRTRIDAIRSAGKRTIGNLREELGKRRVLGSTFATREIASEEARFGQIEEETRAESFLQELELTRQLIGDEFKSALAGIATVLSQLNFESSLAAELSSNASALMQANGEASAEISTARRAGNAEFLTTIAGIFAIFSDRRLKTNIRRIGTRNGYPWYEFDYIWGVHGEGVMSDEIPQRFVINIGGYDLVNYQEVLR